MAARQGGASPDWSRAQEAGNQTSTLPERGAETSPEIEDAKVRLADRLRGPDAPLIEPIEGTPYVVMELTPSGVERLAADPAVHDVQEDRPDPAQ